VKDYIVRSHVQRKKSQINKESREARNGDRLTIESHKENPNNFALLSKSVDSKGNEDRIISSLKKKNE